MKTDEHSPESPENGVKIVVGGRGVTAWRVVMVLLGVIGSFAASYAVLWMRANAPTRAEFERLQENVERIKDGMRSVPNHEPEIKLLDRRVTRLEEWRDSRFPVKTP